ncbi:MAG: hypothetical protein VKK59_00350 [Vampirovibrionales bacterium]|nr:hypothetical protein [Vampirovibrionales bacterium]
MTQFRTAVSTDLLSFLTHGLSARVGVFLRQLEESLACPETLTILYDDDALDAILCGMNQARLNQGISLDQLDAILTAKEASTVV